MNSNEYEDGKNIPLHPFKLVFKNLVYVSFPIFIQQLLRYFQALSNYSFISYADDTSLLGGLGLGMCFYVTLFQAFLFGLNSSIAAICSQLRGMGKIEECGMYVNAGRICNACVSIPMLLILYFSEEILLSWGQSEDIAWQASRFLIGLMPGVFFLAQANLHMYFLNSFKRTRPGMISSVCGLCLQILINCVLFFKLHMGLLGCGLSVSISSIFQSIFIFCCLFYYSEIKEALFWPKFNADQWKYIKQFLAIGVPSLLVSCLQIAGVEMIQPLAGLISPLSNAAEAIISNIYAGIFTIYLGITIGTSIYVGQFIGQQNIPQAKNYSRVAILLILIITVFLIIIINVFKHALASYYTSNEEVISLASSALLYFSLALIPDSIIYSQLGIFRGLGKDKIAFVIQVLSFIIISFPLGIYFAFVLKMNISGFWLGYLIRSVICCAVFAYILWRKFDWEEISQSMIKREETLTNERSSPDKKRDYGTLETSINDM